MHRAVGLLIPLLVAVGAQAQPASFVRDSSASRISFVARSRLLDAHGTFDRWDAEIRFDDQDVSASVVRVTIEAKSVSTGIGLRDRHVRSDAFLATDSFPSITFQSTQVRRLSADSVEITGDLTIRGHAKSITIPSRLVHWDAVTGTGRITGSTTILRDEFGVRYQSRLNRVDPVVEIAFDITFRRDAGAPRGSAPPSPRRPPPRR